MDKQKITQDLIAKELGLSRNTVSKVFNGTGRVSEATRLKVINKAMELNYNHPSLKELLHSEDMNNQKKDFGYYRIVVLGHGLSFTGGFWAPLIKSITTALTEYKAHMLFSIVNSQDEANSVIPSTVSDTTPDGIITIGQFSKKYFEAVANLSIPLVSLDLPYAYAPSDTPCDAVLMENREPVRILASKLIMNGHRDIAFIGNYQSCHSFHERYLGFLDALADHRIPYNPELSFTPDIPIDEYTEEKIFEYYQKLSKFPTAFVCANDILASRVFSLCHPPYSLFKNIDLCGFDGLSEYTSNISNFSTVKTYPEELGYALGELIIWRIKNPGRIFRTVSIPVKVIL